MHPLVCDFCCDPSAVVRWVFNAVPFTVNFHDTHIMSTDGRWAACDECQEFIKLNQWDKLADKSIEVFMNDVGPMNAKACHEYQEYIKLVHNKFKLNRQGSAAPYPYYFC